MNEGMVVKINFGIAATLMASPVWLEWLQYASTTAALLLPIIGACVGLAQLWRLLRR